MTKSKVEVILTSSGDFHKISEESMKLINLATEEFGKQLVWLRTYLPSIGLDPQKVVLAEILSRILGDDINCFGFDYESHSTTMLALGKHNITTRMSTEINAPETPTPLRNRLKKILEEITSLDWNDKSGYTQAVKIWKTQLRDHTKTAIQRNSRYQEALAYKDQHHEAITQGWNEYLRSHYGI